MIPNIEKHPCFNIEARHTHGRVHLPVAPKCNIQCNYCNRKYDCANENRPGVSNGVLSPPQALYYLNRIMEKDSTIAVVGIAGPGDAFATPEDTMETLRLVRKNYPEMLLCVATNGMNVLPYVDELAELQVSHVTITINCVDPDIGEKIYPWARDGKVIYRKRQAVELLIERQLTAIKALKEKGVLVKINTILIPGYNDQHIETVAKTVKEAGADIMNCIPMVPVADTPFEEVPEPAHKDTFKARYQCGKYLPQMAHCTRCRADAVGKLGCDGSFDNQQLLRESKMAQLNPEENRPYVAVASREGMLVNLHLGEAESIWIFEQKGASFQMVEQRKAPPSGCGDDRWNQLSNALHDCKAFLVSNAGKRPSDVLLRNGVQVIEMEGLIEEGLQAVYSGQEIRSPMRAEKRCGSGCAGTGTGCM